MEETLERQKGFLKQAIGEARKKEYHRIKKLQNSKSKAERDILCARFENERIIDQNKISHLSQELDVMKAKTLNGDLSNLNMFRDTIPKHLRAMDKHKANRFAGIEDYEGIVSMGLFSCVVGLNCCRCFMGPLLRSLIDTTECLKQNKTMFLLILTRSIRR